jgi:hypothetical protein
MGVSQKAMSRWPFTGTLVLADGNPAPYRSPFTLRQAQDERLRHALALSLSKGEGCSVVNTSL